MSVFSDRFFKKLHTSKRLFRSARKVLPGGVDSPVRAFKAVGHSPLFMKRGKGAYIYDEDGNRYLDFCMSWGALIHGHCHGPTVKSIIRQTSLGTSFGACTELETQLASRILSNHSYLDKIRFTSSGTEAVMSAIRLARGFTGRNRVIKFSGCYHGHSDSLLVKAGSGLATFGNPDSAGVPKDFAKHTTVLPFNDIRSLENAFNKSADIACAIIEPIAGNMGLIPADEGFVRSLRRITRQTKTLLIFDEVMSGYRAAHGGASQLYGVNPDMATFGKVIGGGLPVGAFAGRAEIMDYLAPEGSVYQAGTLSGNPLAMQAGLASLTNFPETKALKLGRLTEKFCLSIETLLNRKGICVHTPHRGSMFGLFFQKDLPENFESITDTHVKTYSKFFEQMASRGFYLPPSAYEAMFLSTAHKWSDLNNFLRVLEDIEL